ncbi:unnamed protein product [Phytomonas sp. EM1]|nr:unnamed protein product [Phytomonas sp. EM1]|eukprot:CCW62972.1 unnamed protein product [Phytomonas sp. isolate EM1]
MPLQNQFYHRYCARNAEKSCTEFITLTHLHALFVGLQKLNYGVLVSAASTTIALTSSELNGSYCLLHHS